MSSKMTLVRTKANAIDDVAPNVTLPAESEVWHPGEAMPAPHPPGHPIRGYRARLVFDAPLGQTADVVVWRRDDTQHSQGPTTASWAAAGTLAGVPSDQDFFQDDTGSGELYFQLLNITGGNPIAVLVEPLT